MTPEEEKAAALLAVKTAAEKAAEAKVPELVKAGLTTEEAKEAIKGIVQNVMSTVTIKDFDGSQKTIEAVVKAMQDQHDELTKIVNAQKESGEKEGVYIKFVKDNIAKHADIASEKGYNEQLIIKAPALMTTANVTPNVAGGFSPLFGNYIDREIGHVPKPENIILPLVTVKNQPGTESIWYTDRINEEGDAAFIAEGDLKPLADAEWATTKAPVKEVAVRWKFTKRLMNHAPSVVSDFLEHVKELVDAKVDDGILTGNNTGNNLNGLQTVAAPFVVPTQLAAYYQNANIYDVIIAMATRIRLSNFKGQITVVLNTVWQAKMMGLKDNEGRYLMPPFVLADGTRVADIEIKFSNRIVDTAILIGDLKRFNVVWAEKVTYDEGYENDDFSKNLVSRKLEAFIGTYVRRSDAGSILYDDIAGVLTDISAV